jgi:branched-chain amino acid transport system ATP-binding protein
MTAGVPPLLEVRGLSAGYGRTTVLHEIDLDVPAGSVAALLGSNGAGKTTLLRTLAGLLRPSQGKIVFDGASIDDLRPDERAGKGLCLIPEGRGVFPNLTVRENLRLQCPRGGDESLIELAVDAFPALGRRMSERAGRMSGGEQQMLALARCFVARPRLVLLDEVSMGLAPRIVDEIFAVLDRLARDGVSIVLVEQYVSRALHMAENAYLLAKGRIAFSGPASDLDEDEVMRRYLGADVHAATVSP